MLLGVIQLTLPILVAVVILALVIYTISAGNRAARSRAPLPAFARWAAGIAGVVWIVAAFGFGFLAFILFLAGVMGSQEDWVGAAVSLIATPVTFGLGLLLFAPNRRVLFLSTLWAALWAAVFAIVVLSPSGGSLVAMMIAPIVAGLLSLVSWMRIAQ